MDTASRGLVDQGATVVITHRVREDNQLLTTLAVTGTVVFLMAYVIMPRYTKLIKRWLFT
jgi:hypothetical protein